MLLRMPDPPPGSQWRMFPLGDIWLTPGAVQRVQRVGRTHLEAALLLHSECKCPCGTLACYDRLFRALTRGLPITTEHMSPHVVSAGQIVVSTDVDAGLTIVTTGTEDLKAIWAEAFQTLTR